ncbi:hypothetical protein H0W26_05010 [Candidatus Dependentiae bacterium]|nr:hypothetical protein [Candidatus Dependentiae bacterium]
MTLHKAVVLLSMLSVGAETVAFSSTYAPHTVAAVAGVSCVYSGYKIYKHTGGDLTALTLDEGLPYAATTLAVLYGYYYFSTQKIAFKQLERERNNARKVTSVAYFKSSLIEMAKKYGIWFKEGRVIDSSSEPLGLYEVVRNLLTTTGSVYQLQCTLLEDSKTLHMSKATFEVKENSSDDESEKEWEIADALKQEMIYNANALIGYIQKLLAVLNEHKHFFILEIAVTGPGRFDYTEEKRIRDKQLDASEFAQEIERHIYAKYNGAAFQFPFVSYVEQLEKERSTLETALKSLEHYNVLAFQREVIKESQGLLSLVTNVIQQVVITEVYKAQKAQKPLFDRDEEVHRQKLKANRQLVEKAISELNNSLRREENLSLALASLRFK